MTSLNAPDGIHFLITKAVIMSAFAVFHEKQNQIFKLKGYLPIILSKQGLLIGRCSDG